MTSLFQLANQQLTENIVWQHCILIFLLLIFIIISWLLAGMCFKLIRYSENLCTESIKFVRKIVSQTCHTRHPRTQCLSLNILSSPRSHNLWPSQGGASQMGQITLLKISIYLIFSQQFQNVLKIKKNFFTIYHFSQNFYKVFLKFYITFYKYYLLLVVWNISLILRNILPK